MVSYETIPADPAAEDGLLAKPKPKISLKRVLGAAAITSFILGAVAATALSMPAGVPQTMLKGDPYCTDDNAHADGSDLSNHLNELMNGDYPGFIFRYRFDKQVPCDETNYDCGDTQCKDDNCGVAATVLSNKANTKNPVYCIENAHGCDSPSVGYALADHWSIYGGSDSIGGWAYYPTDANSVDGRDWKNNKGLGTGLPGQGCHIDDPYDKQQYLQVDNKHFVTYDTYACKCDYDHFTPSKFGQYLQKHIKEHAAEWITEKITGVSGYKQPAYFGQDMSVCWLDETNPLDKVFEMQNSLFQTRKSWWNGAVGQNSVPDAHWEKGKDWYQGWNEVAFDAKIDYNDHLYMLDALIVVLPDGLQSLCELDKDIAQEVDEALNMYWDDGYGKDENLPVLILKNTKEGGKFMKETFVQEFSFESGNCIYTNGDGYGNHYYKGDGC